MQSMKPGTRIEKYEIVGPIGQGGMADVYQAKDMELGRIVALKLLPPEFARDPERVARFMKEVRNSAAITHPNVVPVYDVGEGNGIYFYTMAYLPGGDLKDRIRAGMTPETALDFLNQMAGALGAAHAKGIVHRDVKPENILFDEEGHAVLTDLGIARAVLGGTRMTRTGMSIGTPHYMSPEQAQGKKVDGRSDLYSLGIVFFEMLTGQVPFDGENTVGIALQHVQADMPGLPSEFGRLQPLLDRLLAKNPMDRYTSAAELIQAIEMVLAGKKLPAPRKSKPFHGVQPEAVRQPGRGSSLKWGFFGALMALLTVGALLAYQHYTAVKPVAQGGSPAQVVDTLANDQKQEKTDDPVTAIPPEPPKPVVPPSMMERARQRQSMTPDPWLACTMVPEPLPVKSFCILPTLIARMANIGSLELIDGYELKDDGRFRVTVNPDSRYDKQNLRRTSYIEIYGIVEPGELTRIYGYLTFRQPDSPQGHYDKRLDTFPQVPFDLFSNKNHIVLGNASISKSGALGNQILFEPAHLEVTDLWLSNGAKKATQIQFKSDGFWFKDWNDSMRIDGIELSLAANFERPSATLDFSLDFGRFEFIDNSKPVLALAPGKLTLKSVSAPSKALYSLKGHLDSKQFFFSEQKVQVDWRNFNLDLDLGTYHQQALEQFVASWCRLFFKETGLLESGWKSKKMALLQLQYRLADLLAKGLQLTVKDASGVLAGRQLKSRGSVKWDPGVGSMIGKSDFSEKEFFSYSRIEFNFEGAQQAFENFSFPAPVWPYLQKAADKQVLTVGSNGLISFYLTGRGENFYFQGQPFESVFN